jgi:hypothetical protein
MALPLANRMILKKMANKSVHFLTRPLQNLTTRDRAGLLEKPYSGTFYRSGTQRSVPMLELTTFEIVGFP